MSCTRTARGLLALLLTVVVAGCAGQQGAAQQGALSPQLNTVARGPVGVFPADGRKAAPALAGPALDGSPVDVQSLRGQVVVLNFWASWCPPCRAEAAGLAAVATATAADGVTFVGVNIKDDRNAAQRFEQDHQTPYRSIFDQPGTTLLRFREFVPQVPPTTLVLDRQGRIAARFVGAVTESELLAPVRAIARENA